jgi:hypothetical protein
MNLDMFSGFSILFDTTISLTLPIWIAHFNILWVQVILIAAQVILLAVLIYLLALDEFVKFCYKCH